jgi:amino acid adenylation domain-containing protein
LPPVSNEHKNLLSLGVCAVMVESKKTLLSGFAHSVGAFAERPALEVAGETLSYGELGRRAAGIGAAIAERSPDGAPPLTAVFASRSPAAFAGVLGALWAGHGYVPLNPAFPAKRCRDMLLRSGCRTLVVDAASAERLDQLLEGIDEPPAIIAPDEGGGALDSTAEPVFPSEDAIAYLLFTSGSTGQPKGVGVTHRNVVSFVEAVAERYGIDENDRFSQTFDMTFDLSVFDMFVAWGRGACVCCPSERQLMAPSRFIRDSELSVWFSVPSLGAVMRRLRMLKPASYPSLRWSLFCGEPLPAELAGAWAAAAPSSVVENLYGPTEATIACTLHRFVAGETGGDNGVVPIGEPIGATRTLVVDPDLREVAPGGDGELLVSGPQVTPGYWKDAEKTAAAFVIPPGQGETHYRTGDRVRRPLQPGEPLAYVGRMDHQIKVLGHRVELGEVEAVLRDASGIDAAIAVGWPLTESGAGGIAAFLGDPGIDLQALRSALSERLPEYMVPRRFELLEALPLNANGKFDRKAMLALLQSEQTAPARL